MAQLSARGRKEVARFEKTVQTPDSDLTVSRKTVVALMTDNTVLENETVTFRADGRPHNYGWKVKAKLKPESSPEKWSEQYANRGWIRI